MRVEREAIGVVEHPQPSVEGPQRVGEASQVRVVGRGHDVSTICQRRGPVRGQVEVPDRSSSRGRGDFARPRVVGLAVRCALDAVDDDHPLGQLVAGDVLGRGLDEGCLVS